MAIFNYSIECASAVRAKQVKDMIRATDIYQDGLDVQDEVVSVLSKQGLIDELRVFSFCNFIDLSIVVWNEDLEFEEAEKLDRLELFEYDWSDYRKRK
ncbi:hypothetical protein P4B35_17505 [Pontiellaceae bacterium B12227]|nr:hypothetical protein [Pontiellaceae bacterium B12227]